MQALLAEASARASDGLARAERASRDAERRCVGRPRSPGDLMRALEAREAREKLHHAQMRLGRFMEERPRFAAATRREAPASRRAPDVDVGAPRRRLPAASIRVYAANDRVGVSREAAEAELAAAWLGRGVPVVTEDDTACACGGVFELLPARGLQRCGRCGTTQRSHAPTVSATPFCKAGVSGRVDLRRGCLYVRKSHLVHWLKTSQAKEHTIVPPEILEMVCGSLYRRKVSVARLNPEQISRSLRQLAQEAGGVDEKKRIRRYYANARSIYCALSGQPPLRMTPAHEEALADMFELVQAPFEDVRHRFDRKNLISYSFVLRKCIELLSSSSHPEMARFLELFPRLRGKDRVSLADQTWRKICRANAWRFIPTTTGGGQKQQT